MSRNVTDTPMKFQSKPLLLLLSIISLSPSYALADEYQRGYTTQHSCYKNEYREEYFPGTKSSPGYVKSYTDTIKVPCTQSQLESVLNNNYRSYKKSYRSKAFTSNQYTTTRTSCSAGSATTAGLLGGGLAAVLSKKDAYGWSVPLGAILGMGVANADC